MHDRNFQERVVTMKIDFNPDLNNVVVYITSQSYRFYSAQYLQFMGLINVQRVLSFTVLNIHIILNLTQFRPSFIAGRKGKQFCWRPEKLEFCSKTGTLIFLEFILSELNTH